VKVNIMLRIYASKWHVYAGLAILNPSAKIQIHQYAQSVTDLFKMMLKGDLEALKKRVYSARDAVFKNENGRAPILLSEEVLDGFSLSRQSAPSTSDTSGSAHQSENNSNPSNGSHSTHTPDLDKSGNSHLSLLAMVDCWATLGIHPFTHLDLLATPIFRLLIGVAEYLFRSEERLDAAIHSAIHDVFHRSDDIEFVIASRGWSQCVSFGSFDLYEERFKRTARFFEPRFADATALGSRMIKAILEDQ